MQNSIAQGLLVLALIIAPSWAGPATQPAANSPAPQPDVDRILVLPFYEAAPTNQVWVGKAIQQDLMADLTHATRARIEAPATTPAVQDAAAALEAGKKAGAALVVCGQFQNVAGQTRVTGQVLSVNSGQAVGSISSTAPANDLFPLEDAVSMQVLRALPADLLTSPLPPIPGASTAPAIATGADALAQTSPTTPQPSQPTTQYYSYTYPDYSSGPPSLYPNEYVGSPYYYGYPYYWYSIPYYGPDVFFFYGWDHYHHHHHDFGGADRWHESGLHEFGRANGHFGSIGTSHAPQGRSFGGSASRGGGGGGFHGGGGAHR